MLNEAVNRLRGQARIRVESPFPERILNLCSARGLGFWDLQWESPDAFTCRMRWRDWERLRGAAAELTGKVQLIGREGASYALRRLRRRQALVLGLTLGAAALFLGSFFIWDFTVTGNDTVPRETILRALERCGVGVGTFGLSLDGEDIRENIRGMVAETIAEAAGHTPVENDADLQDRLQSLYRLFVRPGEVVYHDGLGVEELTEQLQTIADRVYAQREEAFGLMPDGTPLMRELERVVMLRVVDEYWMDHIDAMDDLRRGIGLRGYGNVKPIDAYKQEGFDMFEQMIAGIRAEVVRRIYTIRVRKEEKVERKSVSKNAVANAGGDASVKKQPVKKVKKPGRNDPCPCGKLRPNGLPMKYKDCCGKNG